MFYLQQEYWIPADVDVMYVTTRPCSHRTNQIRNVPSAEPPARRVHGDRMRDARCRIQTPRRPSRSLSPSHRLRECKIAEAIYRGLSGEAPSASFSSTRESASSHGGIVIPKVCASRWHDRRELAGRPAGRG